MDIVRVFSKILFAFIKHHPLPSVSADSLGKVLLFCVVLNAIIPFFMVYLNTSRGIKLTQTVVISALSIQTLFSWLLFGISRGIFAPIGFKMSGLTYRAEIVKIPLNFLPNSIEVNWIVLFDGFGSSFIVLTSFVMLLCFVYSFNSPKELLSRNQILLLLIINFSLINFFIAGDLFFHVFLL